MFRLLINNYAALYFTLLDLKIPHTWNRKYDLSSYINHILKVDNTCPWHWKWNWCLLSMWSLEWQLMSDVQMCQCAHVLSQWKNDVVTTVVNTSYHIMSLRIINCIHPDILITGLHTGRYMEPAIRGPYQQLIFCIRLPQNFKLYLKKEREFCWWNLFFWYWLETYYTQVCKYSMKMCINTS